MVAGTSPLRWKSGIGSDLARLEDNGDLVTRKTGYYESRAHSGKNYLNGHLWSPGMNSLLKARPQRWPHQTVTRGMRDSETQGGLAFSHCTGEFKGGK